MFPLFVCFRKAVGPTGMNGRPALKRVEVVGDTASGNALMINVTEMILKKSRATLRNVFHKHGETGFHARFPVESGFKFANDYVTDNSVRPQTSKQELAINNSAPRSSH